MSLLAFQAVMFRTWNYFPPLTTFYHFPSHLINQDHNLLRELQLNGYITPLKVSRHFRKELVVPWNHSSLGQLHRLNSFGAGLCPLNAGTQPAPHATLLCPSRIPSLAVGVMCYSTLFSWQLLHPTPGLVLSHQGPSCTS